MTGVGCSGFLNNRYQDPTTGTFITVDPLVQSTGHPYDYANNNPINLSDATGLDAKSWCNDSDCASGSKPLFDPVSWAWIMQYIGLWHPTHWEGDTVVQKEDGRLSQNTKRAERDNRLGCGISCIIIDDYEEQFTQADGIDLDFAGMSECIGECVQTSVTVLEYDPRTGRAGDDKDTLGVKLLDVASMIPLDDACGPAGFLCELVISSGTNAIAAEERGKGGHTTFDATALVVHYNE